MFEILKKIYHYIAVFILACVFSFGLFYLFLHPLDINSFVGARLGSANLISNSATVPINPFNKLAMQLEAKEKELKEIERNLGVMEEELNKRGSLQYNRLLFIVVAILISLLVLILLNFYFDHRRKKKLSQMEKKQKKDEVFKV